MVSRPQHPARARLVLTGAPGSGKTSVGARLAALLGCPFLDVDAQIEQDQQRSIPDIFAQAGEVGFRQLEEATTLHALEQEAVVALGGGAVTSPTLRRALRPHKVVWLQADIPTALARVGTDTSRPLLADDPAGHLARLMAERTPLYAEVANLTVRTDGRSVDDIAAEILQWLGRRRPDRQPDARRAEAGPPMTEVMVRSERPYPVRIGPGVRSQLPEFLGSATKVALIHPPALTHVATELAGLMRSDWVEVVLLPVPDGETAKQPATLLACWQELSRVGLTRSDLVVGLGGGATTDLAGFVAATWLRGVQWIAVPTTVLGMVDAGVGGKTGIDLPSGKNLVGAFHEPVAVLEDLNLLATLPTEQVRAGMGEIIKHGFIADEAILGLIEQDPAAALSVGGHPMAELIMRSVQVKAAVVATDVREATSTGNGIGRELLNYGHTLGHAIEALSGFRRPHGECVGLGMIFAAELSHRMLGLSPATVQRHRSVLASVGLSTSYRDADWTSLSPLVGRDKKARGGHLRFVGLRAIGQGRIIEDPPQEVLDECLANLAR